MIFSADRMQTSMNPAAAPGEVLVLLDDVSDLHAGFYMVDVVRDGWAIMRTVIDDEEADKLYISDELLHLPLEALELFMQVGINLRPENC
jgi:hypothetical protein